MNCDVDADRCCLCYLFDHRLHDDQHFAVVSMGFVVAPNPHPMHLIDFYAFAKHLLIQPEIKIKKTNSFEFRFAYKLQILVLLLYHDNDEQIKKKQLKAKDKKKTRT